MATLYYLLRYSSPLYSALCGFDSSLIIVDNSLLYGDTRLFCFIRSKVYVCHRINDDLHLYNEVVKIAHGERISLDALWPSLQDSGWDVVAPDSPILGFQEQIPVRGRLADDVERCYGKAFKPASFVLRGSLQHVSVNVLEILTVPLDRHRARQPKDLQNCARMSKSISPATRASMVELSAANRGEGRHHSGANNDDSVTTGSTGIFYAAEGLVHGTSFVAAEGAIGTAELALESIRRANASELNLARHVVEVVGSVVNVRLDMAQWAVDHASKLFNIIKVEFSSMYILIHADEGAPPLTATAEGRVFGSLILIWLASSRSSSYSFGKRSQSLQSRFIYWENTGSLRPVFSGWKSSSCL
ncbi:hypothetical protein HD806DRAFT_534203 [Xylariaceae sp. AK1471]|nr:hypothetical protein HD806DRAFT_534203 [Xylariaceae sp. AK1471]